MERVALPFFMANKKKYFKLKDVFNLFRKDIMEELKEEMLNVVAPRYIAILQELYEMTFVGWGGGEYDSERRMVYGVPVFHYDKPAVIISGDSISLEIRCYAADEDGSPHQLWYWLDEGTPPYTNSKKSAPFKIRNYRRFVNGDGLDRGPQFNQGDFETDANGEFITKVINMGQERAGIEAQNLTELILEEFYARIQRDRTLRGKYKINVDISGF